MASVRDIVDWLADADPLATPEVEARARLLLLDTLGCMIAGLAKPEPAGLARMLAAVAPGAVRLPGANVGLSPLGAAYVAGVAACWDEACEGLARAHGRPGLHSFGPALALGLARNRSLGDILTALTAGFEMAGRMGEAMRIRPGMHVDGVWGTFGAVTAAARLLGLSASELAQAIEGAACYLPFSLYLPVRQGATVRNAYVGEAATRGIMQALAVQAGLTSPAAATSEFRKLALAGDAAPLDLSAADQWLILEGYLKPFAAVRHVHYGVQAAIDWRSANPGVAPGDVGSVALAIYGEAIDYCGNRAPKTAIQAQFSLSYGLARALVVGDVAPDAYTSDALADPEVNRLERLIEITEDVAATRDARRKAVLTVGTADGRQRVVADAAPGDLSFPLTRSDIAAKFLRYAGQALGRDRAAKISAALLQGPLQAKLAAAISA